MDLDEGACAALVVEHVHKEFHSDKFSEILSDNSEAELTGFTFTTEKGKKRKHGNLTDVSCSSYSSGAGSPLNLIPYSLGFIGKGGFESNDENSDSSRPKSLSGLKGYQSATTAVVSDSEDEIDFPNDVTDLDTFAVEYEPPETNSEDENDDDESDEEPIIVIPSSSEEEDAGAEGGDEYDVDSDNEDSWECPECWTINFPMTTKCLKCWKERMSWVQHFNRTASAPTQSTSKDIITIAPSLTKSHSLPSSNTDIRSVSSLLLEKKIAVSLSRSSSSCSSSAQTSCDSGISVSSFETDTEKTVSTDGKNPCDDTNKETTNDLAAETGALTVTGNMSSELNDKTNTEIPGLAAERLPANANETPRTSTSDPHINNSILEKSSKENDDSLHLCVICSSEPRNASIIHGRSGHQVCCVTCAEKLKADKKRCPVCRKRINFVIKNFL